MKIEALTSLRFFAALAVVFHHMYFLSQSDSELLVWTYRNIFEEGFIGVTFFFILSGFILSHAYKQNLLKMTITTKQFFLLRIARIFPLHIITVVLALPAIWYGTQSDDFDLRGILANLFLLQGFFSDKEIFFSLNIPSWSLSVEMFFYILFPVLLYKSNRVLLLFCFCSLVWQIYIINSALTEVEKHYYIYIFPFSRLIDFVVGILLYRYYLSTQRLVKGKNLPLIQFCSILTLLFFIIMKSYVPITLRYDLYYILPMSLVILAFSFQVQKTKKGISRPLFVLLGEASFSLYMIHYLVIRYSSYLKSIIWPNSSVYGDILLAMFCLVASVTISILMYLLIEKKVQFWIKTNVIYKHNRI